MALVSEEISFADVPKDRQLSSVLSGTLYLNALDGKQVPLRPSEALSFTEFTGTLRSIAGPMACNWSFSRQSKV